MFRGFFLALWLGGWLTILPASGAAQARLRILTTIAPVYSWTASIVGDLATVENLLPADVGPHDFQFRPRDLKKVQSADLILLNGLGIESWLEKALLNNATAKPQRIVRTSDGLKAELIYHLPELTLDPKNAKHDHKHDHDHAAAGETPNPHVWLDPQYARHAVSNILTAVSELDPRNAAAYRQNATRYLDQLRILDADIRALTTSLPNKSIVTYHDAFPYFARRYGFELVGVVEEVPSVGPSPKYLSELSRVIQQRHVRVIFTEPQFEPRLVRQLTRDLGITFAELDVLETGKLTPEAYIEGMRRNLKTLALVLK